MRIVLVSEDFDNNYEKLKIPNRKAYSQLLLYSVCPKLAIV
jgi:hypothetical protein